MSSIFFTSDTHFGHKNILKYCPARADRWPGVFKGTAIDPKIDVSVMDEGMIELWNKTVGKNDIVYHLGDVSFSDVIRTISILKRLNGQKVLISGNHDKLVLKNSTIQECFTSVTPYLEINAGHQFVLFHFPIASWHQAHRGSIHLHGHTHGTLSQSGGKRFDVGVDSNQITGTVEHRPFNIDEVLLAAGKQHYQSIDHHAPTPSTVEM